MGSTKENNFIYSKKNQVYRKIFENKNTELYDKLVKKDCNCLYYDNEHPLYCLVLLLIIIILAMIPALGWIILIELDLGGLYLENCI
jgi:hypothetical protein